MGIPSHPAIRNLFPAAAEVVYGGIKHLLLPHQPAETYLLRKHGFDVPAPILTHYDWPGTHKPFDAQRTTCAHLTQNPRAYVLSSMGTGKTKAVLWAFDYLRGNNLAKKMIVFASLSTLNFVWAREILSTTPHLKHAILYGDRKRRLEKLALDDVDIYIINHDGHRVVFDELMKRTDIDVVVLDELAVYRNGGSRRTKTMKKYVEKMKWVWGQTGSPIPTSPTDAWAQAKLITPHTVPEYFGTFRNNLMLKVSQFKFVPRADAVEKAFKALQPSVRFTLDDIVELPPVIERMVDVDMGPTQRNIYKELATKAYVAVQNHEITGANAGAVMMKLLQVACGWVYSSSGAVVPLDNLKRVEALIDAINSTDRKVLVFSPFKHTMSGISLALSKEGIDHATVSGDTAMGARSEIFNYFQNTARYRVLNCHPQCLAHGITLTAADTVVWFAPILSLEIYEQANARIRRVGQKHKQLILHLRATPVEKRIYSLLQHHQQVQNELLTLFEAATLINEEK